MKQDYGFQAFRFSSLIAYERATEPGEFKENRVDSAIIWSYGVNHYISSANYYTVSLNESLTVSLAFVNHKDWHYTTSSIIANAMDLNS